MLFCTWPLMLTFDLAGNIPVATWSKTLLQPTMFSKQCGFAKFLRFFFLRPVRFTVKRLFSQLQRMRHFQHKLRSTVLLSWRPKGSYRPTLKVAVSMRPYFDSCQLWARVIHTVM